MHFSFLSGFFSSARQKWRSKEHRAPVFFTASSIMLSVAQLLSGVGIASESCVVRIDPGVQCVLAGRSSDPEREEGFRLALTEFKPGGSRDPLSENVDYAKVDVSLLGTPAWDSFSKQPSSGAVTVIVDNIQTHETYRTARTAGIKYFQGDYF